MTMLAHSLAFLAVLVAPVPAAGTLRGGHNSPHVIMDDTAASPAVHRASLARRRRLVEQDAVKWIIHRNANAEITSVVAGEKPKMNPKCPVTCKGMRFNGLDLVDVKPGEKRVDAVHVFHSSSAKKGCHAQGLQGHYTGLTIRAFGWHVHTSSCLPKKSGDAAPLMTHKCKHDLVTAQCKCTCNYA